MKVKVGFRGKNVNIEARKVSFIGKFSGLMFKAEKTENLLFEFNKEGNWAIHSFFVFFPFLAIWLDKNNKVVEHRIVEPFRAVIKPKKKFIRLVEVPVNFANRDLIKLFS